MGELDVKRLWRFLRKCFMDVQPKKPFEIRSIEAAPPDETPPDSGPFEANAAVAEVGSLT